jgi:RNA polymerase sigma-70 factor (ECF subfamily)
MAPLKAHAVFEILVREHADRLMAYLRAVSLDASTADDLFQETMLRAWRRLDTYDHARPFGPWLRGIARRVALEGGRARPCLAEEHVLEAIERHADRFDGPQGTDFRERLALLQGCVQALGEPYATTVDLVYRGGQPLERVADSLRENVETVKKRVQRARAMIAECLHRKGAFA